MFSRRLYLVYFFLSEIWAVLDVVKNQRQYEDQIRANRNKRNIETITIETVVILDEDYISYLRSYGHKTNESLYELVALKWMGVQAEWGRDDVLGYDVRIAIKEVVLWETNPSWYTPSSLLDTTLYQFCTRANSRGLWKDYDYIHLFTGKRNSEGISGRANIGKMCVDGDKCAVSAITSVLEYVITAHELGHSLGMSHDGDVGCPGPNDGIMGSKTMGWSECSVSSVTELMSYPSAVCVFTTDVLTDNKINLTEAWPGMVYTNDDLCAMRYGSGYRYKSNSQTECSSYTCVDLDRNSPLYGVSHSHNRPTDGSNCGDEMVCISQITSDKCISWNETGLDRSLFVSVKGNWSPWSSMTSCSRTCGTGVRYRQRYCNNPKPRNSVWCKGNEIEAELCNMESCAGDSAVESELIRQRASETCAYWRQNNVYQVIGEDAANYLDTGGKYSNNNHGQCEVKCDTVANYTGKERNGIIPDGTPCAPDLVSSFIENNNLPRKSGMFGTCVQGYCYLFGCNNKTGSTQLDECGVCGGSNTTCKIVEGVYDIVLMKGERGSIAVVPANAYLIQFYFKYGDMKNHFLELRTADTDKGIIIYRTLDTTKKPVVFAGTEWYLLWHKQYLYAQGPIDHEVVIKLFNYGDNNNTGVNFAYSLPQEPGGSTTISSPVTTTNTTTPTISSTISTSPVPSSLSSSSIQTSSKQSSTTSSRLTEATPHTTITYISSSPKMETTEIITGEIVGVFLGVIIAAELSC